MSVCHKFKTLLQKESRNAAEAQAEAFVEAGVAAEAEAEAGAGSLGGR